MDSQIVTLARFRICANATRTPDAITLSNHRISLQDCVYARAAERSGDSLPTSGGNLPKANCSKIVYNSSLHTTTQ
ncbi:hypothetical protein [uncultured Helicobacter sp.]|uniref:hypothetical protein n=1 Tax=uncultured Helicobacter sp. TaxID=175537 RepID=UPI00375039B0